MKAKFQEVLLRSRAGNRIVGARVRGTSGGTLLFLPPLRYDEDEFLRYEADSEEGIWTSEALQFGHKLIAHLSNLADELKRSSQATPAPLWTSDAQFRLAKEVQFEARIKAIDGEIAELRKKKATLESESREVGGLRRLLYEQGAPLEIAIREVLVLLGFSVTGYADGDSEFDAIFVSTEGRCLGEVEGKDSKAINIDKLSQLERNLQEDFAREEVAAYAKGVLFGNAHRLSPLTDRGRILHGKMQICRHPGGDSSCTHS